MSRPLRSALITGASPLLRAGPPAEAATVLSASRFLPPGALPLAAGTIGAGRRCRHPPSHVPCRSRRPGSRRLHAGHRLASRRAPARLIPGPFNRPGFDAICLLRHVVSGSLALAFPVPPDASRAPFPQRSPRRSSANAARGGLTPPPRRATPKGHTFISCTAPHPARSPTPQPHLPRSWRT
jgi:hypothetical protein